MRIASFALAEPPSATGRLKRATTLKREDGASFLSLSWRLPLRSRDADFSGVATNRSSSRRRETAASDVMSGQPPPTLSLTELGKYSDVTLASSVTSSSDVSASGTPATHAAPRRSANATSSSNMTSLVSPGPVMAKLALTTASVISSSCVAEGLDV